MNRKTLRTALASTLALVAIAGGGIINSSLAPNTSYGPVASTLAPNTSYGPVASTLSPGAFQAAGVADTSFGPASTLAPVARQRNGGVADDRPVADLCPDSTLRPASSLLSSL